MVRISLDDNLVYTESIGDTFIHTSKGKGELKVDWFLDLQDPAKLYTLMVTDVDAPYPIKKYKSFHRLQYLHLLIVNIIGNEVNTGDTLVSYISPSPPSDSLPHRYYVSIYQQEHQINNNLNENNNVNENNRAYFDPKEFVKVNNLTLVDRGFFRVGTNVPTYGSINNSNNNDNNSNNDDNYSYAPSEPSYFKSNSSLPEQKEKWCRCVVKVSSKQSQECLEQKAWFKTIGESKCYNPYAICSKSVGTSSRECGDNYEFNNFSDQELKSYGYLHKDLDVPAPYNRNKMLDNIATWKRSKGK